MNEIIFIFSYNREEMLRNVTGCVQGHNYFIIDDGSDFYLSDLRFHQYSHRGKEKWYELWNIAFELARTYDLIVFTVDDFMDLQIDKIIELHNRLIDNPYTCNIIRDKRDYCWNQIPVRKVDDNIQQIGFVDCGFFCNREVLEMLNYKIYDIDSRRFKNKSISSGVGEQLTARINKLGIPIYRPVQSLATHGDHPSVMNPEARRITKILSI